MKFQTGDLAAITFFQRKDHPYVGDVVRVLGVKRRNTLTYSVTPAPGKSHRYVKENHLKLIKRAVDA